MEHRAHLLTVLPVVKAPVLKRGPAVADGGSAGEPDAWEVSGGVSVCPPEEQAAGLLSEDWDPGLKAGHGNPEDAEHIRSCLSAEVRPWT